MTRLEATTPTEAEDELRCEVRAFLAAEQLRGGFRPGLGMAAGYDPAFSERLAGHGWVGMSIPEQYGGSSCSAVERFVVTEELLAVGAPVTAHWIADRQIAPSIARYGSAELKQRFLPAIAAGTCYFSLGMSEPDAGSDLGAVRTVARQVDGGWIVNGEKTWTSLVHLNQYVMVLARRAGTAPESRDLVQLIVDRASPGVHVQPLPLLTGEHHFNSLHMDDVFVPGELLLGEPGAGWEQVTNELVLERSGPDRYMSVVPLLAGLLDGLEGHPDLLFTAVFGGLLGRLWSIRQLSLSIARLADRGIISNVHSAMVKDLGTVLEQDMVDAVRRLGRIEIVQDSESALIRLMEEAVLMAPSFTIRGGTTEVLRSIVARGLDAL